MPSSRNPAPRRAVADHAPEPTTEAAIAALVERYLAQKTASTTPTNGAAPRSLFDEYCTPDELAHELGITERHLYERHKVGLAPPRTVIGRTILYHKYQ